MNKKNFSIIIAFIACITLCDCGNTSKNSIPFETPESPKKVLNDFIDATETKPETVSDLIDGFSFGMSEKQYQVHLSKLKKLKGDHVNLDIDGVSYDVVWEKSEIARFGIGFYWHGGDDVIYEKYCHNETVLSAYQNDLSTATNEDLISFLEIYNADDYVVTWTGLFGKKHERLVRENKLLKYKNDSKYTVYKY